jgi:hypothetical protein
VAFRISSAHTTSQVLVAEYIKGQSGITPERQRVSLDEMVAEQEARREEEEMDDGDSDEDDEVDFAELMAQAIRPLGPRDLHVMHTHLGPCGVSAALHAGVVWKEWLGVVRSGQEWLKVVRSGQE